MGSDTGLKQEGGGRGKGNVTAIKKTLKRLFCFAKKWAGHAPSLDTLLWPTKLAVLLSAQSVLKFLNAAPIQTRTRYLYRCVSLLICFSMSNEDDDVLVRLTQ